MKGKLYVKNSNYVVYENGSVFSLLSNKFLKPTLSSNGYYYHSLYNGYDKNTKKSKYKLERVHRIVAETLLDNPNNYPHINHIDGDKSNNRITNLEWCTRKQNMRHAVGTGLLVIPKKYEDLSLIFEDYISQKYSLKEIEEKYNWHISSKLSCMYLKEYALKHNRLEEYEQARKAIKKNAGIQSTLTQRKKVRQYSKENHTLIKEWEAIKIAAHSLGINDANIVKVCQHKKKSAGGFIWEYAYEN